MSETGDRAETTLDWDPDAPPYSSVRQAVRFSLAALGPHRKWKYRLTVAGSASLAILDLIAVTMLAALSGLVVVLVSSSNGGNAPFRIPTFGMDPREFIVVAGLSAAVLLAVKSALSWWMFKRISLFTAACSPTFASAIYRRFVSAPYPQASGLTVQEVVTSVGTGSNSMASILSGLGAFIAEVVLMILLGVLLFVASPLLLLVSLLYFGAIAVVIGRVVGKRATETTRVAAAMSLLGSQTLSESVGLAREVRLYGLADGFVSRLEKHQIVGAKAAAVQQSWFQVPRYLLETALVVGFALAAAVAFGTQSPDRAAITIGVFLVSSTRLIPSLQRLNGIWSSMKVNVSLLFQMGPVMGLDRGTDADAVQTRVAEQGAGTKTITFEHVSYQYPKADQPAIRDVSFQFASGSHVALVGSTGAGKSTITELILGLVQPTSGLIRTWNTEEVPTGIRVAAVPQDVYIAPDTVRSNVSLDTVAELADDDRVWEALTAAQLDDVIRALPEGLDTQLGERGARLSGGEVQRLGLARALYRRPELLVLDEATSSLDAETERKVTAAIAALSGDITVITVAHRLATVRTADLVLFLMKGQLVGAGPFDQLIEKHPELARAAQLQGLQADSGSPNAD